MQRSAEPRRLGRRGAAGLEFAAVAPFLVLLVLGTFDLVQMLRAQLRLETVAVQVGQIVSQCTQITKPGDTSQFWGHAQQIAGQVADLNHPGGGSVIVSAVVNENGANRVAWQEQTGNLSFASAIGVEGGPATLPGGFRVPVGQTLIATEVFATIRPWVLSANLLDGDMRQNVHGTTLYLSRAPDPAQLRQRPTDSSTKVCTA
jgi:Flp pilus assembly protein TadG